MLQLILMPSLLTRPYTYKISPGLGVRSVRMPEQGLRLDIKILNRFYFNPFGLMFWVMDGMALLNSIYFPLHL
jgi:hypothetical protein